VAFVLHHKIQDLQSKSKDKLSFFAHALFQEIGQWLSLSRNLSAAEFQFSQQTSQLMQQSLSVGAWALLIDHCTTSSQTKSVWQVLRGKVDRENDVVFLQQVLGRCSSTSLTQFTLLLESVSKRFGDAVSLPDGHPFSDIFQILQKPVRL
jgi:hypothetical protein